MTRNFTSSDGYRLVAERIVRLASAGGIGSRPVEYWRLKVFTTAGAITRTLIQDVGNVLNFDTVLGITQSMQVGTSLAYALPNLAQPNLKRNAANPASIPEQDIEIPSTVLSANGTTDYLEFIIHGTTKK